MHTTRLLAALTLALVTSLAAAQNDTPGAGKRAKLDTNGDGQVSKEEAANRPKLVKNFDRIDTNKDGQLSRAELQAARAAGKPAKPVQPQ